VTNERNRKMEPLNAYLGAQVRDTVTGFTGVCMAFSVYATGCNQVGVCPPVDKDGKPQDWHWYDQERIEILVPAVFVVGGPQPVPPRRS